MDTRNRALVRLGVLLGVTTLAIAYATSADAQAVDDGPCPNGMIAVAGPGSDYADGRWSLVADGTVFGRSDAEDTCIAPLATVDVTPYPGSDGIEVNKFVARCAPLDGVLVWAYGPDRGSGEFRCLSPAASRGEPVTPSPTPTGALPVTR